MKKPGQSSTKMQFTRSKSCPNIAKEVVVKTCTGHPSPNRWSKGVYPMTPTLTYKEITALSKKGSDEWL